MPDGDIIRGLKPLYQLPYKELCEGKATSYDCARSLIRALKKDLQRKGSVPIALAKKMGGILSQAMSGVDEFGSVDFPSLNMKFDSLAQQASGSSYLKELVIRSAKYVLAQYRYGVEVDACSASKLIIRQYMAEVYEAEFKEAMPIMPRSESSPEGEIIQQRLNDVEPLILACIDDFSEKATVDENLNKLRMPILLKAQKSTDLNNEDLLAEHNHANTIKSDGLLECFSGDLLITMKEINETFMSGHGERS